MLAASSSGQGFKPVKPCTVAVAEVVCGFCWEAGVLGPPSSGGSGEMTGAHLSSSMGVGLALIGGGGGAEDWALSQVRRASANSFFGRTRWTTRSQTPSRPKCHSCYTSPRSFFDTYRCSKIPLQCIFFFLPAESFLSASKVWLPGSRRPPKDQMWRSFVSAGSFLKRPRSTVCTDSLSLDCTSKDF